MKKDLSFQTPLKFSLIVPVFHESEIVFSCIENLQRLHQRENSEIIVVDGSETHDTIDVITAPNVRCLQTKPGRAMQMNAGVTAARGDILVFIHADTELPVHALDVIDQALKDSQIVGGAFTLRFRTTKWFVQSIAITGTMRSRLTRIPYGDQVIFLRKNYFQTLGGYSEIPVLEDIDLMRHIKKVKGRIVILEETVYTSPRRFEKEGVLYTLLRDILLVVLFQRGVSPEKLKRWYQ